MTAVFITKIGLPLKSINLISLPSMDLKLNLYAWLFAFELLDITIPSIINTNRRIIFMFQVFQTSFMVLSIRSLPLD